MRTLQQLTLNSFAAKIKSKNKFVNKKMENCFIFLCALLFKKRLFWLFVLLFAVNVVVV
jgi:hypothetical protein